MRQLVLALICSLGFLLSGCGGGGTAGFRATPTPTPTITVTLTPPAANLMSDAAAQFTAIVNGTTNSNVTWSVDEGAAGGSISSTGFYTAPSSEGVFHVRAASLAAPSAVATATVTVGTPLPPAQSMWGVWGSGPSDVWVVGDAVTYYWNGTKWHSTFIPSKYGFYADYISAVWGTGPTDVWQGGTSIGLELKQWNGSSWTDFPPNLASYIWGFWGSGANDIWGFGNSAYSTWYHWDGGAWTFDYFHPSTGESYFMQAGWGSGSNDIWAVGGGDDTGQKLRAASIFHWDGTSWTQYVSGLNSPLLGIWGSSASDIWAVGENGLIAHWDGSAWSPVPSGTTQILWSVWGFAANDIWAVGGAGTVLHWDGSVWSPVVTSNTHDLHAVWGSGPNDIWAVGDQVILHLP